MTATRNLPLLILPGIMSSGMEVRKSGVDEKHVGERVWLNPIALGLGSFYSGDAMEAKAAEESKKKQKKWLGEEKKKDESDSESDEIAAEKAQENNPELYRCKSAWMQHLCLKSDMCTERDGNEIRPMKGLDGVDFLTDIAAIKVGASYVFGPIIQLLKNVGYKKGVDLDAATYDWRVPPSVLEERDGYFTETLERIEKMYADCDQTPVVLLCHSMGTKTGHYLLNFAEKHKGRDWIDKHIHTYMPVGGPHLGAPSLLGQCFNGSLNPALDPMLTVEERLTFARSLGSAAWLMPTTLPSDVGAIPAFICKKEGKLEIKIDSIGDCDPLVRNEHGTRDVLPFKISVKLGDQKAKSSVVDYHETPEPDQTFSCSDSFFFATSPILEEGSLGKLKITFKEPGDLRAHDKEPQNKLLNAFDYINRDKNIRKAVSASRAACGTYQSNIAMTVPTNIDDIQGLAAGKEIEMTIPIVARYDMTLWGCEPKKNHRSIQLKLRLKWTPPVSNEDGKDILPIAQLASSNNTPFAPSPVVESTMDSSAQYEPVNGQAALQAEGMGEAMGRLVKERYHEDPIGPRTKSSVDAPPVSRVYAVYGTNLDTWVSSVCKRAPSHVPKDGVTTPQFVLDESTKLVSSKDSGYTLKDGMIWETASTPQRDLKTGKTVKKSGDGTVPYWSLQQPYHWQSPTCDVRVHEMEGAEHRAILNDKRFHQFLLDFLVKQQSPDQQWRPMPSSGALEGIGSLKASLQGN